MHAYARWLRTPDTAFDLGKQQIRKLLAHMCKLTVSKGGVTFPWNSPVVLAPLCSGLVVVAMFCIWEWKGAKLPIVPSKSNVDSWYAVEVFSVDTLPLLVKCIYSSMLRSAVSILRCLSSKSCLMRTNTYRHVSLTTAQ